MEDKSKLLEMLREIREKGTPEQFQRAQEMYQNKFGNPEMVQGRRLFDVKAGPESVVKGITDKIDTKDVQKLIKGEDFVNKIADIRALKRLGKAIPGIGTVMGIGSAIASGDASAAVPILDEAEALGPDANSLEGKLERGEINMGQFMNLKNLIQPRSPKREGQTPTNELQMDDSARRQGEMMARQPTQNEQLDQNKVDFKKFNSLLNQLRGK